MVIKQAAGSRQQAAGSRQQAAGSRQQAAGSRQQAAGSRQHLNYTHNIGLSDLSHGLTSKASFTLHSQSANCLYANTDLSGSKDTLLTKILMSFQSINQTAQLFLIPSKYYRLTSLFSLLLIILLFLILVVNRANAALSSTTANSIQGNKPYLLLPDSVTKLNNLNDLLGFSMWDGTYESNGVTKHMVRIDASMANNVLTAPSGMTYSDVVALVNVNGNLENLMNITVNDDDGDAAIASNTNVTGAMRATWYNDGVAITSAELGQTLTACSGPYTLKVEVPSAVSANTTYGDPNTNAYGTHDGITYTFEPNEKIICTIQPKDLTVYPGTDSSSVKYASGYNSSTWQRAKGFKVSAGFPTTGFVNAVFKIIGSGSDQSKYRCSSPDNGGKITLSGAASKVLGQNCVVTYNSATKTAFVAGGVPTITLEYNTDNNGWVVVDSYAIPIPSKWAIGYGMMNYGNMSSLSNSSSFDTLNTCRVMVDGNASPMTLKTQVLDMTNEGKAWRQKYLYRRDELTNSPLADTTNYPENSSTYIVANYYSRDIGTFMSEWGDVANYDSSPWSTPAKIYWTAEAYSTVYQLTVSSNGYVGFAYANYPVTGAICRGD